MGKAVQHFFAFTDALHGKAVIFLIQKKSCFLTINHIYQITDAIFLNFHAGIKFIADKAFDFGQSFLGALIGITALIDTADPDTVRLQDFF